MSDITAPTHAAPHIRALQNSDWPAWRRLWTEYLKFYGTSVGDDVYQTTFARLLSDDAGEFSAFLALDGDGAPVGLVHYGYHRHCWSVANVCYLQDLYVDETARGGGYGRALMEAVYAAADAAGATNVYWTTQHFNETARRLYDRIGVLTPFIKYNRR